MWLCCYSVCVVITNWVEPKPPSVCGECPQPCLEISCTLARRKIIPLYSTFNSNSSGHCNIHISWRWSIFFSPPLSPSPAFPPLSFGHAPYLSPICSSISSDGTKLSQLNKNVSNIHTLCWIVFFFLVCVLVSVRPCVLCCSTKFYLAILKLESPGFGMQAKNLNAS